MIPASAAVPLPTYNQVTKHNLAAMQPMIVGLLKHASFLALDAEFTGLGQNAQTTRAKDIQERYQHLCALAKSHAMVAFGLSIFIRVESQEGKEAGGEGTADPQRSAFQVHNFNFSMLSENDYMVSPSSMVFLAENGLDLNQWVLEGIPYSGGDRLTNDGGRGNPNGIMRSIFKRIMTRRVPVVVHNGFLDLIFLYHSFYANLPPRLSTFVADLSDMFEGGIFDTKYISDYMTRERSSFLAYLFRKYERFNTKAREEQKGSSSSIKKPTYSEFTVQAALPIPSRPTPPSSTASSSGSKRRSNNHSQGADTLEYCETYAFHGVCKQKMQCGKSHDLDLILDAEEAQQENKRRKTHKSTQGSTNNNNGDGSATPEESDPSSLTVVSPTPISTLAPESTPIAERTIAATVAFSAVAITGPATEKFHSAYFDAFMTGTVFSFQLNKHTPEKIETESMNKIYLIGKDFPLKLEKSAFTNYSPAHERQRTMS
ncbi:Target of EGR1, member 1 (Nuclear) [Gryganskiella cystojenkinii]|nr:Target of EGR1, member 1 (Nuclear) [Gryganskiella cystojenkinii]